MQGKLLYTFQELSHEHTRPVGTLMKVRFYTYQVRLMLIKDDRSLHTTTSNQLCKFPSATCHIGSHRPRRRRSTSALGLSQEGSNDGMICNAVFYSLPGVDICSLYYIRTTHHRPGKVIFVLYLSCIYTQNFRVKLSVPCSTHLNACPSVEDSLVQLCIGGGGGKGMSRNPYLNVIL